MTAFISGLEYVRDKASEEFHQLDAQLNARRALAEKIAKVRHSTWLVFEEVDDMSNGMEKEDII